MKLDFRASNTVPPSEYDDSGGHDVMESLDFNDIRGQDVNDPVWPTHDIRNDATMDQPHSGGHSHDGLRTATGLLDLMTDIVDESIDWIERDTMEGRGHRPQRKKDRPVSLNTFPRAAKSARCNTFYLDQMKRIVEERIDRQRVVITNWSTQSIFISHDSNAVQNIAGTTQPTPGQVQIAPQASRTFYTTGELWAFPNIYGTAQQLDVQDEYGWPIDDY